MKKLFEFKTKTIVATGLGAALFTLLFMYVKIPTGIPETDIQTAYGIGAFFAALFGPIAGGLIAFIGHALSDGIQYGSIWWSCQRHFLLHYRSRISEASCGRR